MRSSVTTYSAVMVCKCGARFAAATRDACYALLAEHERRAGCGHNARDTARRRR